jgi:hypothetical protein
MKIVRAQARRSERGLTGTLVSLGVFMDSRGGRGQKGRVGLGEGEDGNDGG